MKITITVTDRTKIKGKLKSVRRELPATIREALEYLALDIFRRMPMGKRGSRNG